MKKFNIRQIKLSLTSMGAIYLIIGILQQLLVNSIFQTSIIAIAASLLFIFTNKDNKKLLSIFSIVGVLNISGIFINRFTLLSFLGLTSSLLGFVLLIVGLVNYYKQEGKIIAKILVTISSLLLVFAAGFLSLTTVRPDITMGWLGNSVTKVENKTTATQIESTLENGTRLVSDIQYDTKVPNGFLDVYYTNESTSDYKPTLIFIHGGGYVWGDKVGGDPNAVDSSFTNSTTANFLSQGYNVVQMNYALAPEYPFPTAIKQLNRGLDYLVNHSKELDLNMENIVIGGGSAGGNLAGLLINIQTNPEYAKLLGESNVINKDYIKAAVFEGGLFDNSKFGVTGSAMVDWSFTQLGRIYLQINELQTDSKTVTPSNVINYVTKNFPPSFISDGNTGTFNEQAFAISEKLDNLGVDAKLNYYSKEKVSLSHGFEESGSKYAKETFQNMFKFLNKYVVKANTQF